jgi:hypothetical protein
MGGRRTILGLSIRLLHLWGLRRSHVVGAACATAALALLAAGRPNASRRTNAASIEQTPLERHARALLALRANSAGPSIVDVSLAPSSDGFTATWVRARSDGRSVVECAALARDGSVRSEPVALSSSSFAMRPTVARAGDRAVVAWIDAVPPERPLLVPFWAVLDERCRVVLSPRPIGFVARFNFSVSIAVQGASVAFVSRTFSREAITDFVVRSLSGEALVEADVLSSSLGLWAGVAPLGGGEWLVAHDDLDEERMRSAIHLRRVSARGAVLSDRVLRRADGAMEFVRVRADERGTVVYWGEDGWGFARRYNPFLSVIRAGNAGSPVALGPRRTASHPDIACNDTGCTSAWIGVGSGEDDRPQWLTERYTIDGQRARGPFALAGDAKVSLHSAPAIAATASGDAFLTLAPTRDGLRAQRLDAEGRPQGAPRELSL